MKFEKSGACMTDIFMQSSGENKNVRLGSSLESLGLGLRHFETRLETLFVSFGLESFLSRL